MKKILLTLLAVLTFSALSAQTLWSEDFTNGIPSTWTMFNDNNTAHNTSFTNAWNASSTYGNPAPGVVSASWFDPAGVADRWLITDSFTVPDSGYVFSLEAACYEAGYPDGFMVKVSTTNRDSRAAFTETIITVPAATTDFTEYRGSLNAFAGQTIYIAVIQNSNDMNFLIADNFRVYVPSQNEIQLLSVSLPAYVAGGANTNVNGVVKNMGDQPLTSFDVTYNVNGGDNVAVYNVNDINVAYGETFEFSHNVPFNESAFGQYTIQMTVSNPNNVEDPTPTDNVASTSTIVYDASATVARTSILEQFTGAACGWCPNGHDRIEQALAGSNTIWAVHHAGYGNDGLTCSANTAYTFFYNAGGSTYAPAMMVDRFHGDAEEPGPVTSVYSVEGIISYINTVNQIPCFLTLNTDGITYNANTRALGGNVTGHFTSDIYGENTRLTLMIVEDSNIMAQTDYSTGSSVTLQNYMHMNAVRATATDTWGDAINVDANGDFTYNVSYTLPANLKAWRCRIIAIVSDRKSNDANACAVMQASQTANLNAPFVGLDNAKEINLSVYPNPTTGIVTVEGDGVKNVEVMDMAGRMVMTTNNSVVDMTNLSNGIYMIRINTEKGAFTQKIVKK